MVYGTYNELVTGANLNQQTSLGRATLSDFFHGFGPMFQIHWRRSRLRD